MPCETCPKAHKCLYYQTDSVQWCDYWNDYWRHNFNTVSTGTTPIEPTQDNKTKDIEEDK